MSYGVTFRSGSGDALTSADRLLRKIASMTVPVTDLDFNYVTIPTVVSSLPYWMATATQHGIYAGYIYAYPAFGSKVTSTILVLTVLTALSPAVIDFYGY